MLRGVVERQGGTPVIVAGDLNAVPESRVLAGATAYLEDAWTSGASEPAADDGFTYPAGEPVKRIDYVLYRADDRLRCVERRVIGEPVASDHRPVLAVFALRR